jgi:hypothetical protein
VPENRYMSEESKKSEHNRGGDSDGGADFRKLSLFSRAANSSGLATRDEDWLMRMSSTSPHGDIHQHQEHGSGQVQQPGGSDGLLYPAPPRSVRSGGSKPSSRLHTASSHRPGTKGRGSRPGTQHSARTSSGERASSPSRLSIGGRGGWESGSGVDFIQLSGQFQECAELDGASGGNASPGARPSKWSHERKGRGGGGEEGGGKEGKFGAMFADEKPSSSVAAQPRPQPPPNPHDEAAYLASQVNHV